ncbi:jg19559 [Pararge aegeria aegeria]|uniref:Jg19559 protein n=1 Tax=Pararge aegeria aegeria TaxID=348720 RepID=A0A8S4RET2_9NEOP|nr:jg19559 [Pararge aegeria aegeria]
MDTELRHCPVNKHLSILDITDSPLCRACMKTDETPKHVMLQCNGVVEQRAAHLGSSSPQQHFKKQLATWAAF